MVYRDHRLQLVYVRCPECGTNAPVTEFPMAARWMRRVGAFVVALMLMASLAILAADTGASSAAIYEAAWEFGQGFSGALSAEGHKLPTPTGANAQMIDWLAPMALVEDSATLAAVGADPVARAAAWRRFWPSLVPGVIIMCVSGAVWGAVLLHRPLLRASLWLLVPHTLATLFATFGFIVSSVPPARGGGAIGMGYPDLAFREYALPALLLAIAVLLPIRFAAFLVARPILRAVAQVVLPTKLRKAVADTWADPLPPVNG